MGQAESKEKNKLADANKKHVIRAAGGVVWRPSTDAAGEPGVEIAVIHRPQYDDWSLPKGKLAPGESEVEGAIREVWEETGFRVFLGRPLGEVRYQKPSGGGSRPKVVRYWAMQVDGGSFLPTREVDDLKWASLGEAQQLLTHERDRELLERFVRGPALAGSVLLVRHATAGERSKWADDDRQRPLDEHGWEQADELVRLLSRFDVNAIISADYLRCVQTVEPLSRVLRLPIREEKLFSEDGYPGNESEALELIRKFGRKPSATVICSQGDVIPFLLQELADADHVVLPDPPPMKKGSVWSLIFDDARLFSAEYFPPPL